MLPPNPAIPRAPVLTAQVFITYGRTVNGYGMIGVVLTEDRMVLGCLQGVGAPSIKDIGTPITVGITGLEALGVEILICEICKYLPVSCKKLGCK